jgi:lipopolysaccharide cholinephosphotransferase
MNLRELQLAELDILKRVLFFIKDNNLSYFILGGTLLGAVRHKGFIPWDDDIDIGMPREDYELFVQNIKNSLPEFLQIRNFKDDPLYDQYVTRIEHKYIVLKRDDAREVKETFLWIDIFPLDGMPSGKIKQKVHMFRLLLRRLLLQYSKFKKGVNVKKRRSLFEKLLIICGHAITVFFKPNTRKQLFVIDHLLKKYPYNSSDYLVNFMGAYKFKEMFPQTYYGNGSPYQFEDIEVCGPVEYDKILSQMYGNYLEFPPEKERFSHSISVDI